MFQVFHLDVVKVDMRCFICCKPMFQVFLCLDVCFKYIIWKLHILLWLYMHVSRVCFKCFRYFRRMLQVFYLDATKVDQNIAYAAISIHTSFERMFQVLRLFFRRMLYVFHLDILELDRGSTCCNGAGG
jgi:hypothetical protein